MRVAFARPTGLLSLCASAGIRKTKPWLTDKRDLLGQGMGELRDKMEINMVAERGYNNPRELPGRWGSANRLAGRPHQHRGVLWEYAGGTVPCWGICQGLREWRGQCSGRFLRELGDNRPRLGWRRYFAQVGSSSRSSSRGI